jgi:hypothetical protein
MKLEELSITENSTVTEINTCTTFRNQSKIPNNFSTTINLKKTLESKGEDELCMREHNPKYYTEERERIERLCIHS